MKLNIYPNKKLYAEAHSITRQKVYTLIKNGEVLEIRNTKDKLLGFASKNQFIKYAITLLN